MIQIEATDQDLIDRAQAGDGEAFGMLVGRYERAVYNLALRTMRESEEAKDATQEAFFKAYRSLRTFRPGAKFSTWIFTIAYHACCDRLAKKRRYSNEELPDRADPSPGPAAEAERRDEARRLRSAIDALPEKYRAVITLYHLQGKQYDEIATVLGLPMGTVKTHLFRAKDLLRKKLNDEPEEDEGAGPGAVQRGSDSMKYDDDSLERALAALPLEETPGDLHEHIMAATVLRPVPVMRGWELLICAVGLALTAWLTLAILGNPLAGGPAEARAIQSIVDAVLGSVSHLFDVRTALWFAGGAFAAILFSQIGIPGIDTTPEIRTET